MLVWQTVRIFFLQIVHETDQVYGVSHSARISTIDAISKEDALEFINKTEKNEEADDEC